MVIGALVLSVGIIISILVGQYPLKKKKNQLDPSIDHELGEKSSKVLIIQPHHST